jgi:predicted negative regulator of RcsB-dependent stress response
MADENLTDEQQADIIRRWIRENGAFILGGLGLGLLLLFGWDQWKSSKTRHTEEASGIYEELVDKIRVNDQAAADALLTELISGYSGSPYVDQARFRLAKLSLDRNDFAAAADHLERVIAESSSDEILFVARIRLARIRLQQEQYDAAMAVLDQVDAGSAFYAQANDVRGDIYSAMNRNGEARTAYEAALSDSRQPPSIDRAYVQVKRDSLGVDDSEISAEVAPDVPVETDDASVATD